MWGHPNPPTSNAEGIYERGAGWGTAEIPSRYAVVKLEVSGFNKDKPPLLVVRDDSAAGSPVVEKIWWGGLATETSAPSAGYMVEAPVVLAGDPDPWDDPAKGGDPDERVSRIELLHCGQVVDSVKIRLIKSTRWPSNPAIGVYVVPAVWHDVRTSQVSEGMTTNTVANVYEAFFTPPSQTSEVAPAGSYEVQKLLGQARTQIRLQLLRAVSVGGASTHTCCTVLGCESLSWSRSLGDSAAIDIYDVDHATGPQVDEDCTGATSAYKGYAQARHGAIILGRSSNRKSQENFPFFSSARAPRVVAHELGHLLLLLEHFNQNDNLMVDPRLSHIVEGNLLTAQQVVGTSVIGGRSLLHTAVTGYDLTNRALYGYFLEGMTSLGALTP